MMASMQAAMDGNDFRISAGERLTAVEHLDTFWFAWAAFQPETRLVATRRRP